MLLACVFFPPLTWMWWKCSAMFFFASFFESIRFADRLWGWFVTANVFSVCLSAQLTGWRSKNSTFFTPNNFYEHPVSGTTIVKTSHVDFAIGEKIPHRRYKLLLRDEWNFFLSLFGIDRLIFGRCIKSNPPSCKFPQWEKAKDVENNLVFDYKSFPRCNNDENILSVSIQKLLGE